MADIELVIKIPEEYYTTIKSIPENQCTADMLIIKNGTPLPKGHGRLIDADELKTAFPTCDNSLDIKVASVRAAINHTPTIIEADKESKE